jgi:hypothetical protein
MLSDQLAAGNFVRVGATIGACTLGVVDSDT